MSVSVKIQSPELKKNSNGFLSELRWNLQDPKPYPGVGLFASVSQMGSNENDAGFKIPYADLLVKHVSLPEGFKTVGVTPEEEEEEGLVDKNKRKTKKKNGFKIKISNPSLRRLISGGIAGAVSRTAVAPLETIRTHLMVGSSGHSTKEVFENIMNTGWPGLFRGNFVNVIRVATSKAIELFVYDTVNKNLSSKAVEPPKLPIPPSSVAGACAGVSSTLITYPLELVKTRLTIQAIRIGLMIAFIIYVVAKAIMIRLMIADQFFGRSIMIGHIIGFRLLPTILLGEVRQVLQKRQFHFRVDGCLRLQVKDLEHENKT